MHDSSILWVHALGALSLSVPLTFAVAALWPARAAPFRRAVPVAGSALGLALAVSVGWAIESRGEPVIVSVMSWGAFDLGLRLDTVASVMLSLVCFIALVITRFSRAYLAGDAGQERFVRWQMATLAAVTTLLVVDSLLLLTFAWIATSLCLHQLLTFYADRPQALMAAHKKFLVSRVADVCLVVAVATLGLHAGSSSLSRIHDWAASTRTLPVSVEIAAVLLVLGASLKCAQLPFHGWLTQVMEAPTPVSALLHAGVVNIGGFLMIRLSPVMEKAQIAQTLLVVIGSVTAVVAALVMMTRASVKVTLAWSTCAQMGFMLVQCGLGAYQLALLHLVAHSLYKAHAFLSSGSAVDVWRMQALSEPRPRTTVAQWVSAALAASLGVAAVGAWYGTSLQQEPALWAFATVLSLALTPLLVRGAAKSPAVLGVAAVSGMGVSLAYFSWHALFGELLAVPAASGALGLRVGIAATAFLGLFALQVLLHARPHAAFSRALYAQLHAGLYLDELFTRITFRVWPPRLPAREPHYRGLPVTETLEV